ncbi:MAG TPA: hypothetical protein VMW01_04850 [Williamwhitmania sp.]|nr:hypothetical protein [Williamwhitmania sp.]
MRRYFLITLILLIGGRITYGQSLKGENGELVVNRLMDSLWIHPTSFINHNDPNWIRLNQHLRYIDILKLNGIIHSIFFDDNSFILNRSHAHEGFIGLLNKSLSDGRLKSFHKAIRNGFRDSKQHPNNKIVMIEGDSWFGYPIFLSDISDHLRKKSNLALYTMTSAGDWISNMISSLQYEYTYVKIKPDVFIVSGGGNDMVGDYRLSNFVQRYPISTDEPFLNSYRNYVILRLMKKPVNICSSENCDINYAFYKDSLGIYKTQVDTALLEQIVTGRRYLNKNFYRFVATLKIEYKMLFESLKKISPSQFDSLKIITQGYDYVVPSYKKQFGINNGAYLKEPLMLNGINDPYIEESIMKTIIFEINEMLIELGKEYSNIYHVDSRGITAFYEKYHKKKPSSCWHDELHPKSVIFGIISDTYYDVIENNILSKQKVISVVDTYREKEMVKNRNKKGHKHSKQKSQ